MNLDLLILLVCSTVITLLGLLVFVRNPSQPNNRRFALLSISLVAWTVFNYLSENAATHNLLYTRLTFFGGVATIYTLLSFIANFPTESMFKDNRLFQFHRLLTIVLVPIVFLPGFITSVASKQETGSIKTSYLYGIFIFYVLYSMALLVVAIRRQNNQAKTYVQKQQVFIISWGIILYAILAIASNVLLPLVIDNWSSSRYGPAFTLLLVGVVAYTIIKHRMFDIRLIVARSVAYVMLLGTLAALFAFGVLGVTGIFFKGNQPSLGLRVTYTILAIILAFLLQPLKRFFDRLTNRLFYQDAYDPQVFLDQFNKVIVSNVEINALLQGAGAVIKQNLKADGCTFVINKTEYLPMRVIGDKSWGESIPYDTLFQSKNDMFLFDDMTTDEEGYIKEFMNNNRISVITRLKASNHSNKQSFGMLFLENKRSGSPYSRQDVNVINILTNELVIAIQNALRFEEIQNFNITLQEKVDDATHKLRQTNEKLRALDETKDEFISMASHQLRTPLTSVKGYISMVMEGDAGKVSDMQKKLLDQAFISSQRMVYLIADLLNVSRLRTGKFVIERKPTQLADVIETEILQLTETAKGRNLELTYEKPKNFPKLLLDETKIRQVIMNFADNAIYYTQSGTSKGHIRINLVDTGKSVEFTVVDDGIGVPKDAQHHLFTKFYRADNAQHARPDGTGLGLFMAKKVVIAQGGAIIFKSEEGKGSTFGFSFPKDKLLTLEAGKKK